MGCPLPWSVLDSIPSYKGLVSVEVAISSLALLSVVVMGYDSMWWHTIGNSASDEGAADGKNGNSDSIGAGCDANSPPSTPSKRALRNGAWVVERPLHAWLSSVRPCCSISALVM